MIDQPAHTRKRPRSANDEIKQATEQIIDPATKGDFGPFITALDDEVEIFSEDAPYRFDGKESYLEFLQNEAAGAESTTISFHQPSYRAISDTTAVINSYHRLASIAKGGGAPRVQCGRTTLVLAKRGSQWKIVSAHFSPLAKE